MHAMLAGHVCWSREGHRGSITWEIEMQEYTDWKTKSNTNQAEYTDWKQIQIHIKKRFRSGRGGIAWRVERVILYFLSETCMGGAAAIARLKQKSGKQLKIPMNKDKYNH